MTEWVKVMLLTLPIHAPRRSLPVLLCLLLPKTLLLLPTTHFQSYSPCHFPGTHSLSLPAFLYHSFCAYSFLSLSLYKLPATPCLPLPLSLSLLLPKLFLQLLITPFHCYSLCHCPGTHSLPTSLRTSCSSISLFCLSTQLLNNTSGNHPPTLAA